MAIIHNKKVFTLYQGLLTWVFLVGISSIFLLTLDMFDAILVIFLATIIFGLFIKIHRISYSRSIRPDYLLLTILIIALTLRFKPYLYIMGGQDQGVYVNMSAYYQNFGRAYVIDNLRQTLTNSLQIYYDKNNHWDQSPENNHQSGGIGIHQLGIYLHKLNLSEYVFQFYPLHPIWMAIFGRFLGYDHRVYSLTIFSLLSIYNLFLISNLLVKGSKIPGYLLALLLAVNPLHTFFSKFPVTEIVSLFFSSSGLYFLILYFQNIRKVSLPGTYLSISALGFFSLFFTHTSGFMYLPWFYLITTAMIILVKNTTILKQFLLYFLTIIISFSLSLIYCFVYSRPYFYLIYTYTFSKTLGKDYLTIILSTFTAALLFLLIASKYKKHIRLLLPSLINIVPFITVTIFAISSYKSYLLGFTNKFANNSNIIRWGGSNLGINSLDYSTLFVYISYLSPVLFLIFLILLLKNIICKKTNFWYTSSLLFITIFITARIFFGFFTPYQYYYARYLLSETIPYTISFILIFVWPQIAKNKIYLAAYIVICLITSIYFFSYTKYQNLGQVANGAPQALSQIKQTVNNNLLFLYSNDFKLLAQINTPISYYYNIPLFIFDSFTDLPKIVNNLPQNLPPPYFLISQQPINDPVLNLKKTIFYSEGRFVPTNKIPTQFENIGNFNLYLYEVYNNLPADYIFRDTRKTNPSIIPSKISNFYSDNMWTNGNGILSNINLPITKEDKFLLLDTYGYQPFLNEPDKLKLTIEINDTKKLLFPDHTQENAFFFLIPNDVKNITKINIRSNTFNPAKTLSGSTDNRELGIDVKTIDIK